MPPKKKRKISVPERLGAGNKFLNENFSEVPENLEDVLKGHVLYQVEFKCNKSRAETVKHFLTYQNLPAFSDDQVAGFRKKLDVAIQNVMNQSKKFKKLTEPSELQRYSAMCKEQLPLKLDILNTSALTTVPSTNIPATEPSTSQDDLQSVGNAEVVPPQTVLLSQSPIKTRKLRECKSCERYRASLQSMQDKQSELQKEKAQIVKNMAAKERLSKARVVNQKLKRRENRIEELKARLNSSQPIQELAIAKKALSSAEKKNKQMKKYKETKSSAVKRLSDEHEVENTEFRKMLEDKERQIRELQNEKMALEEKIKEMEEQSKDTKADGKTYSSDMRMMVTFIYLFAHHLCYLLFAILFMRIRIFLLKSIEVLGNSSGTTCIKVNGYILKCSLILLLAISLILLL